MSPKGRPIEANPYFNSRFDKIAVVVREFSVGRKISDPGIYGEPYIVSFAVDEDGIEEGRVDFNSLPFPNVRRGDTISFDGQGHLIYGPKNPGEFLAYSILFMECDQDIREIGHRIREIVKSPATKAILDGVSSTLAAATGSGAIIGAAVSLVDDLALIVATELEKNRDDQLYRRNGTLLRGSSPPFDILRTYKSGNDYITSCKTSVIPLSESNLLGAQPGTIFNLG